MKLYARLEPTTDSLIRSAIKESPSPRNLKPAYDTVLYKDAACTNFYARRPWHYRRPRSEGKLTLNCAVWELEWLPPLEIFPATLEMAHLILTQTSGEAILARFTDGRRSGLNLVRNAVSRTCLEAMTGSRLQYKPASYRKSGRAAFGRAKGGERAKQSPAAILVEWPE